MTCWVLGNCDGISHHFFLIFRNQFFCFTPNHVLNPAFLADRIAYCSCQSPESCTEKRADEGRDSLCCAPSGKAWGVDSGGGGGGGGKGRDIGNAAMTRLQ